MRLINVFILIALLIVSSCADEDPSTADTNACFNFTPETDIKVGDEIIFNSCSENVTTFGWDFGDGAISTEENPAHIYETGGEYVVKLITANETSVDAFSKTIMIADIAGYFSVNETKYPLTKGALVFFNNTSKWHQLILYHSMDFSLSSDEYVSGIGNLVYLDILSGKSKFEITGSYSNNTGSFDATADEIVNMKNSNIYNGFAALAYKFNGDTFEPVANDVVYNFDNVDYNNWSMNISENASVYTIDISFSVGNKSVMIFYEGELTLYEEN